MYRKITIRRLLAILMIAGVTLAPLSGPAMAGTSSDASMQTMAHDMSAPLTTAEMANDATMADMTTAGIPCCPSKAPAPIGCDKCIFMAACTIKCLTGISASIVLPLFFASSGMALPEDDAWPSGMGHPPPDQPPRS